MEIASRPAAVTSYGWRLLADLPCLFTQSAEFGLAHDVNRAANRVAHSGLALPAPCFNAIHVSSRKLIASQKPAATSRSPRGRWNLSCGKARSKSAFMCITRGMTARCSNHDASGRLDESAVSLPCACRNEPGVHQHHPCGQGRLGSGRNHQFRPPTPDDPIPATTCDPLPSTLLLFARHCASSPLPLRLGLCTSHSAV